MSRDVITLNRFVRPERYGDWEAAGRPELLHGLYVDCETTGLDTTADHIIELGLLPFDFDREGNVYGVGAGLNFLNDPGVPIPEEITALTGITQAMVVGQSIDVGVAVVAFDTASLVIAHHAAFDRQMIERCIPDVPTAKPWACSYREVDWPGMFRTPCSKLAHLLIELRDEFYEPHRALDDCEVGLHLLATVEHQKPGQPVRTALSYLLESARQKTVRVWATGAPFDVKDLLKARKSQWNATVKTWYRDMKPGEVAAEVAWLDGHARCPRPRMTEFTAMDRYSVRAE